MLLIIGYIVVLVSTLGGFMVAGGNPAVLLHVSEFIVIGGIAIGILIISTPKDVLMALMSDLMRSFKGSGITRDEVLDVMKLLYELFMLGRRNGLIALDEHLNDPSSSALMQKYKSVADDPERMDFLCNSLRPIIDGKIKPDQMHSILDASIKSMEQEAHRPAGVLVLIGDSLPGVGIIAAVLGIINTMAAIADGPEKVGQKVAAALTGTFLGILGAYGFINPLHKRVEFNIEGRILFYKTIASSVASFAKGLAPLMALEIARRGLDTNIQPSADELEQILKEAAGSA